MVATWTADTISGFGLSLVISQLIEVSNIAIPTLETALAIRIAVNATLPNTPQREEAGAEPFGAAVDGLVNGLDRGFDGESLIPAPVAENWQWRCVFLRPKRSYGWPCSIGR